MYYAMSGKCHSVIFGRDLPMSCIFRAPVAGICVLMHKIL